MTHRPAEIALKSRENLFDLLRVVATFFVVFSHSFSLTGHSDPVNSAIGLELGTIGVLVLFAASGYLLAAGWSQPQTHRAYWIKRALRIMPGLIVSSLITAFAIGVLVTDLSATSYLGQLGPYAYVVKHSLLDTFSSRLPGVFAHNPYPNTVNGSLWTIPVEVCCYFALATGVRAGALRHSRILLAMLGLVCVAMFLGRPPDDPTGTIHDTLDELLGALRPCGAFLTGVVLWVLRDHVPRRTSLILLAALAALLPLPTGLHSAVVILALPYVVAVVGSLRPGRLRWITAQGDVSYGIYVYSFPTQQVIAGAVGGLSPWAMLAIAYPICWVIGLVSWKLIESPAISLRRRLGASSPPEPAQGVALDPEPAPGPPLVSADP